MGELHRSSQHCLPWRDGQVPDQVMSPDLVVRWSVDADAHAEIVDFEARTIGHTDRQAHVDVSGASGRLESEGVHAPFQRFGKRKVQFELLLRPLGTELSVPFRPR